MRNKLMLGLAVFSMLQMGSLAHARDFEARLNDAKVGAVDPSAVKYVGTADDSGSQVRDPQSSPQADGDTMKKAAGDVVDVSHVHPSLGPNGKETWSR